jgi:hypothetical protein
MAFLSKQFHHRAPVPRCAFPMIPEATRNHQTDCSIDPFQWRLNFRAIGYPDLKSLNGG